MRTKNKFKIFMKDKELEKLLHVVLEKYPELDNYIFGVKYNHLSDAFAIYFIQGKKIDIEIAEDLKEKDDKLKIAAIASEISHIIKEKKLSLIPLGLGTLIEGLMYDTFKVYRNYDERRTDIETIKRGFGKELLELLKYDNEDTDEEDPTEGLSINELEKILKINKF